MTAMLTDDELDEVLTGAAARLRAATADVAIGATPSPSFPTSTVLRVAAAVAVIAGATAGVVAVNRGGADGVPAAFERGEFGFEIVQRITDDGAGTQRLVPDPGGQAVRVLSGEAAKAYGAAPESGEPGFRCWIFVDETGVCGVPREPSLDLSGARGPGTVALVHWIPDDVVAVAFEAGDDVRSWARPVDGTAAFPYPVDGDRTATATLVRADGTAVDVLETTDPTPTDDERVTQLTAETLASTPAVYDPPAGWIAGASFVRSRGRQGAATGFDGPFMLQTFRPDSRSGRRSIVEVLTVNERGVEDAQARLSADRVDGSLRVSLVRDGVATFVWAGTDVDDGVAAAFLSAARAATPPADAIDLDTTFSWFGMMDRSMNRFLGAGTIERLLFDRIATVDIKGTSRQLLAGGDDAGTVQFWIEQPFDQQVADIGRDTVTPGFELRLPAVGERLYGGFRAVPPSTRTLTITLDDGTTIEPRLIDVRPTSDAKLAVIPPGLTDRTITAVSST